MSKSTISTFELFEMFPDQETARVYLEGRLWPNGPRCPVCGLGERDHRTQGRLLSLQSMQGRLHGAHRNDIRALARSVAQVGLRDVPACDGAQGHIQLATRPRKSGSRKSRLGSFCIGFAKPAVETFKKLAGIIEIDETFIGGIEANKHEHKKLKAGRGTVGKTAVLGMRERGGRTVATPIDGTDKETVQAAIHQYVEVGSTLHTDEAGAYAGIGDCWLSAMMLSIIALANMFETT